MKKNEHAGRVFPDPTPALIRARKAAEEIARQTGTAIVIAKEGKVVKIHPKPSAKRAKSSKPHG